MRKEQHKSQSDPQHKPELYATVVVHLSAEITSITKRFFNDRDNHSLLRRIAHND